MRKNIKNLVVLVSAGVLAISTPVMAADNEFEVPEKVQSIANGSDDIYGEGVPLEHGANPDTRFSSGGYDHTHQYIVANALVILDNDQGASSFNEETNASILLEATDWPDKLGNETDFGTFAGHFYDPDSGKNWLGQSSPTARTRAESYFEAAVEAYEAGKIEVAMSNLGKGTHYVSDLNEPHHASNLTAINSNHSAFESYVVSAKYSCGFPDPLILLIIVVDRYLDYFTTIMEDRLWQVLAKPVSRWRNRSGLSMNAARAA